MFVYEHAAHGTSFAFFFYGSLHSLLLSAVGVMSSVGDDLFVSERNYILDAGKCTLSLLSMELLFI